MALRVRSLVAGYPELALVLIAAAFGLSWQPPLAWLAGHQGINAALAVLVFATAVTIEPAAVGRIAGAVAVAKCRAGGRNYRAARAVVGGGTDGA